MRPWQLGPTRRTPLSSDLPVILTYRTMRLLRFEENGELGLHLFEDDAEPPPYAILSHTWGTDGDEVTFTDLEQARGKDKPGYEKIRFCGQQAAKDRLEFFWIDTCCINKADIIELCESISSMFRWYQNVARCYVFLSDVMYGKPGIDAETAKLAWTATFQQSRWFKRGWTLQGLLAPRDVEFFSEE